MKTEEVAIMLGLYPLFCLTGLLEGGESDHGASFSITLFPPQDSLPHTPHLSNINRLYLTKDTIPIVSQAFHQSFYLSPSCTTIIFSLVSIYFHILLILKFPGNFYFSWFVSLDPTHNSRQEFTISSVITF